MNFIQNKKNINCPNCNMAMKMTDQTWDDYRTECYYNEYYCDECDTFVQIPMKKDNGVV